MDVNEEFAAKMACVRCGRAVKNKSKWFRLTEQENGLNFYYRCGKCHSVFRGVVTEQMLSRLETLAQQDMSTFTGASLTETPRSFVKSRKQTGEKIPSSRILHNRRTRKDMERYAEAFVKDLYSEGNDFLSQLVLQEGNNWRSESD